MNQKIIASFMATAIILFSCSEEKKDSVPGFDLANLDTTINPVTDFYLYTNGGWLKNHPMPAEYSRYGSFDKLGEENDKKVRELVENLAKEQHDDGSIAQKIGYFVAAGMDTMKIETEGINPLKPEFEKIQKVASIKDIPGLIAYYHSMDINPLFSFYGESDSKNSDMVITQLGQGGLGLGDRDYYVGTDPHSKEIQTEYVKHIVKMFGFAGYSKEAELWSKQVMLIETRLAKASKTRLELRDPESNYHKMKLVDVQTLAPNYDWTAYFSTVGLSIPGDINVCQPEFFKEVNIILKDNSIDDWKAYLTWTLINNMAPYLSSEFTNQNFEFNGKFMSGKKIILPRWRRVLNTTNGTIGEALGQLYVEKYFPASSKERMLKLVENLRVALSEQINGLVWMGDSTKIKAQEKLKAITVKIGYPEKWRDYSNLKIDKDSYVLNVLKGRKFNFDFNVSLINKPVDRTLWGMTPQTVNAYYNPSNNEICFPSGILQPPFFFPEADDAVNYGAIGVVIGHEISHGFDDQGRQYDAKGNLVDWWTAEDAKQFSERTNILIQQFNHFEVLDSTYANGALTLGENIADLGGLNISYTALQKALKENPAPAKTEGFTPEQRFYLAYSHVWGQHISDKEILRRTKEDVHSLGRFRVLGPLPNLSDFHKAFNIKPGDAMYLAEDKRAIIW